MIGSSVAISAASLCINRRLFIITTVQSATISKADKQRAVWTDLGIGVGIPILEMILRTFAMIFTACITHSFYHIEYIVQGHRFNIFEDIGCYPFTYNTPASFPLVYCWPVVIQLVSAAYGCKLIYDYCILSILTSFVGLTIRALLKRYTTGSQLSHDL